MAEILEFPFDSGQLEGADARWLPPNMLAVAQNVRLDTDGALTVRPGNVALAASTYSSASMSAYDLANYNGRLVALGDQMSQGRPTDLFEFTDGLAAWRATQAEAVSFASVMPRMTAARDVGGVPDRAATTTYVDVAATLGLVCALHAHSNNTTTVHVFDPETDQTVLLTTLAYKLPRVVAIGASFYIIGVDSGEDLRVHVYSPGTDETLPASVTTIANVSTIVDVQADTNTIAFAVAISRTGVGVTAFVFNAAGAQTANWLVSASASGGCAVAFNTLVTVGRHDTGTSLYSINTYNTAGALQAGPTTLFSGPTSTRPRLVLKGDGNVGVLCVGQDTSTSSTRDIMCQQVTNQATHSLLAATVYANGDVTALVNIGTKYYAAAQDAAASVDVSPSGTWQLFETDTLIPQAFLDQGLSAVTHITNAISGTARIGTKLYVGRTRRAIDDGLSTLDAGIVTEFETADEDRRQMTELGGQLHIAGALPLAYDGRILTEQAFAERPAIISAASLAGGAKQLLGVYNVQVLWQYFDSQRNLVQSRVSRPQAVTLTTTNQAIRVVCTAPHSLRTNSTLQAPGQNTVRVVVFCTTAGGANFFVDNFTILPTSGIRFGAPVTIDLTQSDANLADNATLYTQQQTPIPHTSPRPYVVAAPARDRIIANTNEPGQWAQSKLLFNREPVVWAPPASLGFEGRVNQPITALASFETVSLVWTKSEIREIGGRGPEQNGTGEFDISLGVPSPGGALDWKAVIVTPIGAFFQMAADKLMILRRGTQGDAGEVEWIGHPVRTTLAAFPRIRAACFVRSQMIVAFACTNTGGSDGVIIVYDMRRQQWFVDTVGPVTALSELDGRLCYVSAGTVFRQELAAGTSTFVTHTLQTAIIPVTKRFGWGHIYRFGIFGSALGACSVAGSIDFDDGAGFLAQGTEAFAGTEVAFERLWSLGRQRGGRFALRFVITHGSPSAALRLNGWAVEVEGSKNMVRLGSTGVVQ